MGATRQKRLIWSQKLAAPACLVLLGSVMFAMALTQPAWVDERIGPGFFAQWLAVLVIALSLAWLALLAITGDMGPSGSAPFDDKPLALRPGLGLLGGVGLFALSFPLLGLVAACALTASVVGWGAGDRGWAARLISPTSGAAIALALGLTILPPSTRLWPSVF